MEKPKRGTNCEVDFNNFIDILQSIWSAQVVFQGTCSPMEIFDQTMPLSAAQNTPAHVPSTSQMSTESRAHVTINLEMTAL